MLLKAHLNFFSFFYLRPMSFEQKIATKSNSELVEILENRDNYVPQFVDFAEFELTNRKINPEQIEEIAIELVTSKVKDALGKYSPLNGKLDIPKSFFLSKEKVLEITKIEFEFWMERKEDFGFDVWKYAIGALM